MAAINVCLFMPQFASKITPSSRVKPLHNHTDHSFLSLTYFRSSFRAIAHCSVFELLYACLLHITFSSPI